MERDRRESTLNGGKILKIPTYLPTYSPPLSLSPLCTNPFARGNVAHVGLGGGAGGGQLVGVALEVPLQLRQVAGGEMLDLREVTLDGSNLPPQVQQTLVARDVVVVKALRGKRQKVS